jgi:PAS domain S-box-containing protein
MLNARDRELLAAIVDSSDDGIVSMTLGGIITSWNRAAERIFGYTAGETVGQSILMLLPADRLAEEEHFLSEIGAGRRVEHFETIRVRKDGALIQVSVSLSPIRDAAGVMAGASKIVRDISERVQLERRAEKAAADLDRVLSNLGEGFAALDRDLRYVSVNDAAVRMVGLPREAVIGRTPAELLPPEVVAQVQPWTFRRPSRPRSSDSTRSHLPTYDRWYDQRLYPSPTALGVLHRHHRPQEGRGGLAARAGTCCRWPCGAGGMGAWSRDLVTGGRWWSREFEELFGIDAPGFEEDRGWVHARWSTRTTARGWRKPSTRRSRRAATTSSSSAFRHGTAAWRWMEGRGRAVYAEGGAAASLHGIGIDITERKAVRGRNWPPRATRPMPPTARRTSSWRCSGTSCAIRCRQSSPRCS